MFWLASQAYDYIQFKRWLEVARHMSVADSTLPLSADQIKGINQQVLETSLLKIINAWSENPDQDMLLT